MVHQSELIAEDIHAYLKTQEEKSLLRFITCGSVDDGKSTLIGRLLWDSRVIFEDQLAALKADSKRVGTQGDAIDYALLLDGLQAEREQGITIDVAYRYFSTEKRKFIVADTPGHEQYTRNMVTGASTAEVAIILIDARKGILTQSRRHSYLASLVGIRQVVLAINKMDLVDYSATRYDLIRREYELFAAQLGFRQITAIPISALQGDNIIAPSINTPWYAGPSLLEHLETLEIDDSAGSRPFRMRVQWVNRPHSDFRGFCGTVAAGRIRQGEEIIVTSSGQTSRVDRIVTMAGDLDEALAGQAVTLTLTDEIDISRGDLLATPAARPDHSDRFAVKLVWLHEQAMLPGRSYLLKAGATTAPAHIETLEYKINVNTLKQEPGDVLEPGSTLQLNEVGSAIIAISREISFDAYRDNRGSGSFILIDRMTNATVGAGMIESPLEKSRGQKPGTPAAGSINRKAVAHILWFLRDSPEEASSLATRVGQQFNARGMPAHLLDAGELRQGLNRDLGDTIGQREEETRRLLEVARICNAAGLIALVRHEQPPAQTVGINVIASADPGSALEEQSEALVQSFFC